MLAIELPKENIDTLFSIKPSELTVDLAHSTITASGHDQIQLRFSLDEFARNLVKAGGWLAFADKKY